MTAAAGSGNLSHGAQGAGVNIPAGLPQITHIEIRRVQNGFVVMALNANIYEQYQLTGAGPQKWSYIAKDTSELGALLTWIAEGNGLNWLPSMDMPIIDIFQRVSDKGEPLTTKNLEEAIRKIMPQPMVMGAEVMNIHPAKAYRP